MKKKSQYYVKNISFHKDARKFQKDCTSLLKYFKTVIYNETIRKDSENKIKQSVKKYFSDIKKDKFKTNYKKQFFATKNVKTLKENIYYIKYK